MRRDEAEREAAVRNRDDPAARRLEFYAFDESAGLSDEAWTVGTRLRPGGSTAPATYAATRAHAAPVLEEDWEAPPAPVPGPGPALAPGPGPAGLAEEEPDHRRPRPGRFMRWLGAAVIVTGMLWMAMLIALAAILKPNDATGVGFYLGAAVLGLLAILLGVAIRRS
jgi:hypothetical protein